MSAPLARTATRVTTGGVVRTAPGRMLYVLQRGAPHRADDVNGVDPDELEAFLATETLVDLYDNPDLTGLPIEQPAVSDQEGLFPYWHEPIDVDHYQPEDRWRPITPIGDARLTILARRRENVMNRAGRGDGVQEDRNSIMATAQYLIDTYGYGTVELSNPHAVLNSQALTLPSEVHYDFVGRGEIVRGGTFTKGVAAPFIRASGASNIEFHNARINGAMDSIPDFGGKFNGHVTVSGTPDGNGNYLATTDGQTAGTVLLDGITGQMPEPSPTDPPYFALLVADDTLGDPKIVRFGTCTQVGPTATLTNTYLSAADAGIEFADDQDFFDHSGNKRMPCMNFSDCEFIRMLGMTRVENWPGQGWQANNPKNCEIEWLWHRGNRGFVVRRAIEALTIGTLDVTCNDDGAAFLGLADGSAAPTGIVADVLRLAKVAPDLFDPFADPEYGGNGLVLMSVQHSKFGQVFVIGGGSDTDIGGDKAGLVICDSSAFATTDLTIPWYENEDSDGYGARIGSRGGVAFMGGGITVNGIIKRADSRGLFTLLEDGSDAGPFFFNLMLEGCGSNGGADDLSSVYVTTPSSATTSLDGYHGKFDVRQPRARSVHFSSAGTGSYSDVDLDVLTTDPNEGGTSKESSILLNNIKHGRLRAHSQRSADGGNKQTDYVAQINGTCSQMQSDEVSGTPGDGTADDLPVYATGVLLDNSSRPVYGGKPQYKKLYGQSTRWSSAAAANNLYGFQPNALNAALIAGALTGNVTINADTTMCGDFYWIAADHPRGTLWRIALEAPVGNTAPGITLTVRIMAVAMASNNMTLSSTGLDLVVTSGQFTANNPNVKETLVTPPADGLYLPCYFVSGAPAQGASKLSVRIEPVRRRDL